MVRDQHATSVDDANALARHLEWLKTYLPSPDELDDTENYRALSWFKPTAQRFITRMWEVKAYVEYYGYLIDLRTTRDPGIIIYQDTWQVSAKPRR